MKIHCKVQLSSESFQATTIDIEEEAANAHWEKGLPYYIVHVRDKSDSTSRFLDMHAFFETTKTLRNSESSSQERWFFRLHHYGRSFTEKTFEHTNWEECVKDYVIFKIANSLCIARPSSHHRNKLKRARNFINRLPHEGQLMQQANYSGMFTCVKVHDAFNFVLLDILFDSHMAQKARPPYYEHQKSVGAHISVIHDYERTFHHVISEKTIRFTPGELKFLRNGIDLMIFLEVECEELSEIREENGLDKLIRGHPFHIAIGYLDEYYEGKT
ncbi:MAG: hypothetical protein WC222_09470 [Parachlamydiales bacterium]|jgi:hypothetical protein